MMVKNIENIENFFINKKNNVAIIPKINQETSIFYELLFRRKSEQNNIIFKKMNTSEDISISSSPSLFNESSILFIESMSAKIDLEELLFISNSDYKIVVILPYALFKKYKNENITPINAYDFKADILSIVNSHMKELVFSDNEKKEFLSFSYHLPHMFFSELNKQLILKKAIISKPDSHLETIKSIRGEIFGLKFDFQIKRLPLIYKLLKKEITVKKFNF